MIKLILVEVDAEDPSDYDNLFTIVSYQNKFGRISTGKSLKGFSGRWRLEIRVRVSIITDIDLKCK